MTMTISKIKSLESGEARWVGRRDIHVYCHRPMRLVQMPTGREGWQRLPEDARYMVQCEHAGPLEGVWMTAVEAARLVDSILAGALPAVA
jgi:hypothetical protein